MGLAILIGAHHCVRSPPHHHQDANVELAASVQPSDNGLQLPGHHQVKRDIPQAGGGVV